MPMSPNSHASGRKRIGNLDTILLSKISLLMSADTELIFWMFHALCDTLDKGLAKRAEWIALV